MNTFNLADDAAFDEVSFRYLTEPVAIADDEGFDAWRQQVRRESWSHVECRPVSDIENVILCLFSRTSFLNALFARATHFNEAPGGPEIPRREQFADAFETPAKFRITGADLRIQGLMIYYETARISCKKGRPEFCPLEQEIEFFENFVSPLSEWNEKAIVVATGWGRDGTMSHELMHGQFFASSDYRAAVAEFWRNVLDEKTRERVRKELATGYDSTDEELMINEFQAYVLQDGKPVKLGWAKETFGDLLKSALDERGVRYLIRTVER